jgi:hypothetical protein
LQTHPTIPTNTAMNAVDTTTCLPLSTHNRRQRAAHPLPQENPMKQSVVFVRNSVNDEENIKEELSCEQSNVDIFRQAPWAKDANSELEEMWTLKRVNPYVLDDDDELYTSPTKRSGTHVFSCTADQQVSE